MAEMMTFQDLTDKVGQAAIYVGTAVDAATQAALLEWNFDRVLTVQDNDNKWLRYYRRNLNMNYPIYQDLLKAELVRTEVSDMFITELMQTIHEGDGSTSDSKSDSHSISKTGSNSEHTVTDNTSVRTPDLTTSGTSGNTRTDNLSSTSQGTDTGTVGVQQSTSDVSNGQTRGVNITYPEANMGSIPSTIGGFPSSIDYAEGESDTFTEGSNTGTNNSTETRNLGNSNTTSNTGTVTDAGTSSTSETGTDTTDFDGDVTKTGSHTETSTDTITGTGSGTTHNESEDNTQGRHESTADILPRAVQAITSTNAIKWLVKQVQVCFDNYAEI